MNEILKYKNFLEEKAHYYESPKFIESDPIKILHQFDLKEDIEITGFLVASISWGNRKMIIKNSEKLIYLMDYSPHDFIINHSQSDLIRFDKYVHRTFNSIDLKYFIKSLKNIYIKYNGLESILSNNSSELFYNIHSLKKIFFELNHEKRTEKHISDPLKGSASKRLNMFLRWMVRSPQKGVDFGIWNKIKSSQLSCPLDVHIGRVARKLGFIKRKQNDFKALNELDSNLRLLDGIDPVKFDFALFGLAINENF
ncbi:MAG: TIGR02757 family protein [Flavobacteriaceae bacterium]|nr:TIGR02757 family protein [Flavobacteriaceae bacterium]